MRDIYACLLRFGGNPDTTITKARAYVRYLIGQQYQGKWPAGTDAPTGQWDPTDDIQIRWRHYAHTSERLWHVDIDGPGDRKDRTMRWHTTVQIGRDATGVFAYTRMSLASTASALTGTVNYTLGPPPWVNQLVDGLLVTDGGRALSVKPWQPGRKRAGELAALLTSTDRHLPIVVTAPNKNGTYTVNCDRLARDLAGLAHVVDLTPKTREALFDLIGRDNVPSEGGANIWWPGWAATSARQHTHQMHMWTLNSQDGSEWPLLRMVYGASAFRVGEPPLRSRLARIDRSQRPDGEALKANVDELLAAYESDLAAMDELEQDHAQTVADLDRTRRELDEVLSTFHTNAAAAAARLATDLAQPPPPEAPKTVLEAVTAAEPVCDRLVFLPEAFTSAQESDFPRPHIVHQSFLTLQDLAQRWADDDLPGGFSAAALAAGLIWRADVSETALGKYGGDYERVYRQQPIVLGPHYGWGNRRPELCRVYLYLDRDRRVIVVGHVGDHLRGAHSN